MFVDGIKGVDLEGQVERQVVRITLVGDVEKIALLDVISKQHSLAQAKDFNRLYDSRNCKLSIQIADLYYLPRNEDKAETERSRSVKIALLTDDVNDRNFHFFYETTAINSGRKVKIFTSEMDAYKWLSN